MQIAASKKKLHLEMPLSKIYDKSLIRGIGELTDDRTSLAEWLNINLESNRQSLLEDVEFISCAEVPHIYCFASNIMHQLFGDFSVTPGERLHEVRANGRSYGQTIVRFKGKGPMYLQLYYVRKDMEEVDLVDVRHMTCNMEEDLYLSIAITPRKLVPHWCWKIFKEGVVDSDFFLTHIQ